MAEPVFNPFSNRSASSKPMRPTPASDSTTPATPQYPPCPPVLISSAEGSKLLVNYPPLDAYKSNLIHLPTADVLFYGNGPDPAKPVSVAIEVKSISDLCSSRDNGRLFAEQLPKMLDAHDTCYLLVYGIVRCSPRDHTTLQEYIESSSHNRQTGAVSKYWSDCKLGARRTVPYGSLVSTLDKAARLNCIPIQVQDMAHAALWIASLARTYAKSYDEQTDALRAFNRSRDTPPPRFDLYDNVTKRMAARIKEEDGVAWDRAYALALHFPSYLDFVHASIEELAEVKTVAATGRETRIGPVVARAIYTGIRQKRPGY